MYHETSYKVMVEAERSLWNDIVRGSCDLMEALYELDEDNSVLSRYINVLFCLRSAKADHDRLVSIQTRIYDANGPRTVDKFGLQKTIKDYLGNIDSVLDYLEHFSDALGKDTLWFERGNEKFDQKINDVRNEVMHEGVPSISFDSGPPHSVTCHTDVGGWVNEPPVIRVKFDLNGEGKWEELGPMVRHTYREVHKLICDITAELCKKLRA